MYVEGNMICGLFQLLHVTLVNEGDETFNDGIRLVYSFFNGTFYLHNTAMYEENTFTIQPGEEKEVGIYIRFNVPTEYRIYVVAGNPLEHFDEPNPVPEDEQKYLLTYCDIETVDYTPRNIDAEITIDNSFDRNDVVESDINYVAGGVKLINNDDTPIFQKWFYLTLTKCPDGDIVKPENELAVQLITNELLANQTIEIPFAFDESALEDGQRYALSVKYSTPDGRVDTTPLFFTYVNPTGIAEVSSEKSHTIYTLAGTKLSTDNTHDLPHGIYIIDGRKSVIKSSF
ncbi:MAG: hypothetical protein IJ549_06450 [Prevotella sp.]|nr:hypothetical protein [Prevotella sp.]